MTTQLISGFGRFNAVDGSNKWWHVEPLAFSIDASSSKNQSKKYVKGVIKTAGAKIGSEEYVLKLSIEALSWTALQFALGREAGTTASLDLAEIRDGRIPLSGAFEFADPDLATALGVQVFIPASGLWGDEGRLTVLATGAPAAKQFRADTAASKLIFNAAQAGAPFLYRIIKNYANIDTIGVEQTAAFLSQFSFSGIAYTDTDELYKVIVPKVNRVSVPSLGLETVSKFELEYDIAIAAGYDTAYQLIRMPASYVG
jgi:hypothetical protein